MTPLMTIVMDRQNGKLCDIENVEHLFFLKTQKGIESLPKAHFFLFLISFQPDGANL